MCAPFVLFLLKMAHQLSTSASIGFEIVLTRCQHAIRSCETICNRLNDLTNLSSSNIFLEMKLSRWFLEIVIDLLTLEVLVPCLNLKRTKNHSHAISKFFVKSIHTSLCNSRNFCLYIKVWYLQKFTLSLSRFFGKNFVKATALLKKLLNS